MLLSGAPTKTTVPFANSGAKNTIPVAASATPGLASYTTGFPALTMTPLSAGGIPPAGQDFNGILNAISQAVQYYSAGATFVYDSTFSSAVSGYPKGAILQNSAGSGLWLNNTDGNTTNPDSSGAGWIPVTTHGIARFTAGGTFVVPLGVTTIYVSATAGGGGGSAGGGSTTSQIGSGGGGGGAGQSVIRQAYTVTPGASTSITVGVGGSAGAGQFGAGGTGGTAGGSTIIGSLQTLTGGQPGFAGILATTGNAGGAQGGAGTPNGAYGSDTTQGNASGNGGAGASGPFGGGGGGGAGRAAGATGGVNAAGFGSGGGGGGGAYAFANTAAGGNGGAGSPGLVIIEW